MSLEGGLEEVVESFREEASCLSNSSILANAAVSRLSNSATRRVNRSQFGHGPRRIFMMRQSTLCLGFHLQHITPVNGDLSLKRQTNDLGAMGEHRTDIVDRAPQGNQASWFRAAEDGQVAADGPW